MPLTRKYSSHNFSSCSTDSKTGAGSSSSPPPTAPKTSTRPSNVRARFDRLVYIGPPDKTGRAAIFKKYLSSMKTSPAINPTDLATATPNFSGAQIEHTCREAGLHCIKQAISANTPPDSIKILPRHFKEAIHSIREQSNINQSHHPATTPVLTCQN